MKRVISILYMKRRLTYALNCSTPLERTRREQDFATGKMWP